MENPNVIFVNSINIIIIIIILFYFFFWNVTSSSFVKDTNFSEKLTASIFTLADESCSFPRNTDTKYTASHNLSL